MSTENNIGKNVAELRRRNGWTQAELAEITQISQRQIQNIEYGKQKKPYPENIRRLEEAFGVPTGTLTSNSIHESMVYYREAKEDARKVSEEWLLRNLSNDTPNTRALSLAISEHIDEHHSLIRGIMEHFGYTTTYIPTFRYSPDQYTQCLKIMKEYDEKAEFTSFFKGWDIYVDEDIDFDAFLKEKEDAYINENLDYPLLIHRLEELEGRFIRNPSLVRTFPLDVRISKNDKIIGQLTLHKFTMLTNRIKKSVDDAILSTEDLHEHPDQTASLIPNLEKDLALNKKINEQKQKLNIEKF